MNITKQTEEDLSSDIKNCEHLINSLMHDLHVLKTNNMPKTTVIGIIALQIRDLWKIPENQAIFIATMAYMIYEHKKSVVLN